MFNAEHFMKLGKRMISGVCSKNEWLYMNINGNIKVWKYF